MNWHLFLKRAAKQRLDQKDKVYPGTWPTARNIADAIPESKKERLDAYNYATILPSDKPGQMWAIYVIEICDGISWRLLQKHWPENDL